jgi:Tol biopolymer transport system component
MGLPLYADRLQFSFLQVWRATLTTMEQVLTNFRGVAILLDFDNVRVGPSSAHSTFPGENGRIAFCRYDPTIGNYDLYTANPDGSGLRQLTLVPSFMSDWSSDGTRIAPDFFEPDGNQQVATINSDGTNLKQITSGRGIHEVPSWSPDGFQIAFDYSPLLPDEPGFFTSL